MTILNGAETKLLTLHMESFALRVFECEDCSIKMRLLSIPGLDTLRVEVYLSLITGNGEGLLLGYLRSFGVDNIDAYRTIGNGTVQEYVSHEVAITFSVNRYPLDVFRRL